MKKNYSRSEFLKNLNIHNDWNSFLNDDILKLIQEAETKVIQNDYTPDKEKVLRFFELPLYSVKVIILGQDPYPQPGVATGRAFEVGNLKSWNDPFKNNSLKNILRALYKSYTNKVLKYNDLKSKFDNVFPVLSPNKLFLHWEKQGVLLLNTSFTCEPGKPGSHKIIWEDFTSQLLFFINENYREITWFLWGNSALEITEKMEIKNKIVSQHPMMCFDGKNRNSDFLFGKINCFKQLQNEIDWTGFNLSTEVKTEISLF